MRCLTSPFVLSLILCLFKSATTSTTFEALVSRMLGFMPVACGRVHENFVAISADMLTPFNISAEIKFNRFSLSLQ